MMCKVCRREDVAVIRGRVEEHSFNGVRCEGSGKLPAATEAEKAQYTPVNEIGF